LAAIGCAPNVDSSDMGGDSTEGSGGTTASAGNGGGAGQSASTGTMGGSASIGGGGGGAGMGGSGGSAGTGAPQPGCPLTPVAAAATTPMAGLIDEWTFEGRDDRLLIDKDHHHEGILHRAVWRSGKFGNALKLYGMPESFAELSSFADNLSSGFTISLFIQTSDKYTVHQKQSILKKGSTGSGQFELWTDLNGAFHFTSSELGDFDSQVDVMDCGPTGSVTCPWHHLAVTYDGNVVTLYVDDAVSAKAATGKVAQTSDTLYFGAASYWGLIDQVRIYDRALAASDISKLRAEGAYTPSVPADTGTIVARVDAGAGTDGIDDFSADHVFAGGGWGYVDGGASTTAIFAENTYSIYDLNHMFRSRRESSKPLTYKFTVPNGSYRVKLYFIEADPGEAAARSMNVTVENKQVLSSYNILADAKELRTGVRKDFGGVVVSDGELTIDLTPLANKKVSIAGIAVQKEDGAVLAAPTPCTPRGPLYQDPTNGKLRDSSSIYNKSRGAWMHFGLGQQSDDSYSDDSFVAAEMSNHGRGPWTALKAPTGRSDNDFGPVVVYDSVRDGYHLFSGSFYKGIRHYTNLDDSLLGWKLESLNVVPGDGKVPEWDPAVWKVANTWYMSTTLSLYESSDLSTWKPSPYANEWPRKGNQNENPTVFFFHGYWWYTADTTNHFWRSSTGFSQWTDMGPTRMTGEGGERLKDQGYWPGNFQRYTFGHDAIIQSDRCFLLYDVKYEGSSFYAGHESRVVNQAVECKYIDGTLYTDANEPFDFDLSASQRGY
jgi:Concanavalin A-like lectin/glucanases superfamily/Malectin domain